MACLCGLGAGWVGTGRHPTLQRCRPAPAQRIGSPGASAGRRHGRGCRRHRAGAAGRRLADRAGGAVAAAGAVAASGLCRAGRLRRRGAGAPAGWRCGRAAPVCAGAAPSRDRLAAAGPARRRWPSASPAAGRARLAERLAPRWKARTCSSPASSRACRRRAPRACGFASTSSRRRLAASRCACRRGCARLVQRLPRRCGARRAAGRAARRPALALRGCGCASRTATLNPHGFDHELKLFEQGVRATGYVRDRAGGPRRCVSPTARATRWSAAAAVRDAIAPTWAIRAPPACWRRWRWATRRRSSATTGSCSAAPAWRT